MHWRRKWQPTPVFLPGESQGQGAWRAAVYGVAQSRTRLKQLSSSSNGETHIENRLMDTQGGKEGEGEIYGKSNMETYNAICKIDSQWEFVV